MPVERFTNNYSTALAASISTTPAAGTVETITMPAAAPAALQSGQFRVRVDNEILLVTAATTTTWTVTRGSEGTTPATHANGAIVRHVLTSAGLIEGIINRGQPQATASQNLSGSMSVTFLGAEERWLRGPLTGNLAVTTSGAVAGSRLKVVAIQGSPARTISVDGLPVTPISPTNTEMISVDVFYIDVAGTITPHITVTSPESDPLAIPKTLIDAVGDLIYGSAADTAARLAIGPDGTVLTAAGGVPTWAAPTGGGGDLTAAIIKAPGAADRNLIQPTADAAQGLVVRRRAGGTVTANTFDVQDAAGTTSALKVEQAGYVSVNMPVATGTGGYQLVVRGDGIFRRSTTDVPGPTLEWWKSRGTVGAETDVVANDEIGAFLSRAYKSGWKGGTYIGMLVTGISGNNIATALDFGTTNADGSWPGSNVRMRIGPDGKITIGRGTGGGAARLDVASGAPGEVGLIVKANGTPSVNLAEFRDNAEAPLFAVNQAGRPRWQAAGIQQTTVGAAGGASALPATPTKYLQVVDSAGTTLVIPAYAAA